MTLQPAPILQDRLSWAPWRGRQGHRLPGTGPCEPDDWLRCDEAFAAQMALRDRLIEMRPDSVIAARPEAAGALQELLGHVLDWIAGREGYAGSANEVRRPDGVTVPLDRARPLHTLGRLVQQDLCVLQAAESEHVLTAAVLCFPAGWTLAEKLGRPLTRIHAPVARYDAAVAPRVQRLFDALRPGIALERHNCLHENDPALHQPMREGNRPPRPGRDAPFVRLERQTLIRLPRTRAVVFAIHTAVLRKDCLDAIDRAALDAHRP